MRYVVGTVAEIPPGGVKIVEVAGRSIGVFNLGGEFFALRNRCPHQGGPMCEGQRLGFAMCPKPGVYEYLREGEFLRCPWHGWEFDIRTGQSYIDPARVRVRKYPVAVEIAAGGAVDPAQGTDSGRSADGVGSSAGGREPGPYLAETYPAWVESAVVVVEVGP